MVADFVPHAAGYPSGAGLAQDAGDGVCTSFKKVFSQQATGRPPAKRI
jgi:hypothetical protein